MQLSSSLIYLSSTPTTELCDIDREGSCSFGRYEAERAANGYLWTPENTSMQARFFVLVIIFFFLVWLCMWLVVGQYASENLRREGRWQFGVLQGRMRRHVLGPNVFNVLSHDSTVKAAAPRASRRDRLQRYVQWTAANITASVLFLLVDVPASLLGYRLVVGLWSVATLPVGAILLISVEIISLILSPGLPLQDPFWSNYENLRRVVEPLLEALPQAVVQMTFLIWQMQTIPGKSIDWLLISSLFASVAQLYTTFFYLQDLSRAYRVSVLGIICQLFNFNNQRYVPFRLVLRKWTAVDYSLVRALTPVREAGRLCCCAVIRAALLLTRAT